MYVLEIIPLSRTAPPDPLSYRSTIDLQPGVIVQVPLRKKIVPGLVIVSMPVREAKFALKSASFSLSKSSAKEIGALPSYLIQAASDVATYHATTLGAVLSALLIPVLSEATPAKLSSGNAFGVEAVEKPLVARRATYQKMVEESSNGTTLLVVPTQIEADGWAVFFKALKPLVLSGKLSAKKREEAITRASEAGATLPLIITTPAFSWVPLPHLTRIIIERVSAGGYTLPKRPYVDVRFALTELARARNVPLVYGDYPLPLEYRTQAQKSLAQKPFGTIEVLDTRSDKAREDSKTTNGPWKAVPDELLHHIRKTIDAQGRVAVLAVRKGYAPTVVCRDCGTAVTDEFGRTLTFTITRGKRLFRSVDGTIEEAAHRKCKVCDSWNLLPLGIGVERVEEELRKAFPNTSIVRIDQENPSGVAGKKLKLDLGEPGTIVVGTEAMLSWLPPETPFELGVIASADSLLALPFWRSRERFVRVALMLAERAARTIVSTRHPEDAALTAITNPTTSDFWKEELNLRKILNYPPFGTLIVFQVEATSARLAQTRTEIKTACEPFTIIELPPRAVSTNTLRGITVLQLPADAWPNKDLSGRLSRLSPTIRVHVDSESLW